MKRKKPGTFFPGFDIFLVKKNVNDAFCDAQHACGDAHGDDV